MPKTITSRSNPRYRRCIDLRRSRVRKRHGAFLIDGSRDLDRALASGLQPETIFVCAGGDQKEVPIDASLQRVISWGINHDCLWQVEPSLYDKLCYGQRVSDCVAIACRGDSDLQDLSLSETPIVVILDGVEKPGNVGAVFRSVDAVGADAILLTGTATDPFNPNAIRASAGAVFTVPCVRCTQQQACDWLGEKQIPISLARVDGQHLHWNLPLDQPVALVFGNEASGLGPEWASKTGRSFRIPMLGITDSLNVSVSTAIVLFEAKRQRFNDG